MTREELLALRDAIDEALAWPDSVRDQIGQWLTPETAKPNGHDPHPPPTASTPRPAQPRQVAPRGPPSNAERRLLAAVRDHPLASATELPKSANASRSSTGERLKRLAARGAIEK